MASIAVAECAAFKQEEARKPEETYICLKQDFGGTVRLSLSLHALMSKAGLAVQDQIDAGSQRAAEAAAEKGMTQQDFQRSRLPCSAKPRFI